MLGLVILFFWMGSFHYVLQCYCKISQDISIELKRCPAGCGLVAVYHCNFILDTLNVSHVRGCELVSVHRCNFTLHIFNLSHVPRCGLVRCINQNFTLDISSLSHVPGCGLVSIYHCSLNLDISSLWCIAKIYPGILNLSHVPGFRLVLVYHYNDWVASNRIPVCAQRTLGSPGFKERKCVAKSCFDVQKKKILQREERFFSVVLSQMDSSNVDMCLIKICR